MLCLNMARSREFDINIVLEKALNLFWEKGYSNTSLSDLTLATGLHKGSLYSAFKSKENLFIEALSLYGDRTRLKFIKKECPLDYIENFLARLIKEGTCKKGSLGCFILNSNIEFGFDKSEPAKLSQSLYKEIEKNFKYSIDLAEKENKISKNVDKEALLARLLGAIFSIREISRFNKNPKMLRDIANGVLKELNREI